MSSLQTECCHDVFGLFGGSKFTDGARMVSENSTVLSDVSLKKRESKKTNKQTNKKTGAKTEPEEAV